MSGRLIAVVGPSGVGKDTVMAALARACPGLDRVRRVITRSQEAGGEDFEGVDEAEFARRRAAGAFALSWRAHGMCYGIPASVGARLSAGEDLLVNLSRSALPAARRQFPRFIVLHLTAPRAVLSERLAARGRESGAEIRGRLERAEEPLPDDIGPVIEVSNDGPLEETVEKIRARLYPEKV